MLSEREEKKISLLQDFKPELHLLWNQGDLGDSGKEGQGPLHSRYPQGRRAACSSQFVPQRGFPDPGAPGTAWGAMTLARLLGVSKIKPLNLGARGGPFPGKRGMLAPEHLLLL